MPEVDARTRAAGSFEAMRDGSLRFPTQAASAQAKAALDALRGVQTRVGLVAGRDDERQVVAVPDEALELLRRALAHLAEGDAVRLVPVHAELTTQEAAELLAVPRPFLVGLLERGVIPHRTVGTRRRIAASDLLAYQQRDGAERRNAARELTGEAQKLGIDS